MREPVSQCDEREKQPCHSFSLDSVDAGWLMGGTRERKEKWPKPAGNSNDKCGAFQRKKTEITEEVMDE